MNSSDSRARMSLHKAGFLISKNNFLTYAEVLWTHVERKLVFDSYSYDVSWFDPPCIFAWANICLLRSLYDIRLVNLRKYFMQYFWQNYYTWLMANIYTALVYFMKLLPRILMGGIYVMKHYIKSMFVILTEDLSKP